MAQYDFSHIDKWPLWEIKNTKRALMVLNGFFNTEEDNMRLEYINKLLKGKKR